MFYVIALCAVMSSCSKQTPEDAVEYLPFKKTQDAEWSMISPDGKTVIDDVISEEDGKYYPSVVKEGRFMVKNDSNLWEFYTMEQQPRKIGGEYRYATHFMDGKAVVAELNGHIKMIDLEGNVVKVLDKIGGNKVRRVCGFSEGYALYLSEDLNYGVIDKDGNEVIKAEYTQLNRCSDGKFVGVHKEYEKEYDKSITDDNACFMYDVLDTKGKLLFQIDSKEYRHTSGYFTDGLMAVYKDDGDKTSVGLINDKNEVVIEPTTKIGRIDGIKGNLFIYRNGDACGVMNTKGEYIVRAKFGSLFFAGEDRLIESKYDYTDNGGKHESRLLDMEGNPVNGMIYKLISSKTTTDGETYFWAEEYDGRCTILDHDGKEVKLQPDIVDYASREGNDEVEDDYTDFQKLFDEMQLTADGVDSMMIFKTSPQEAMQHRADVMGNPSEASPKVCEGKDIMHYDKEYKGVGDVRIFISVRESFSRYSYMWDTYNFTSEPLDGVAVLFYPSKWKGNLVGKMSIVVDALKERFRKYGKVEKENRNAMVVTISEKSRAFIYFNGEQTVAMWGNLKPADELDIEKYADAKEKVEPTPY